MAIPVIECRRGDDDDDNEISLYYRSHLWKRNSCGRPFRWVEVITLNGEPARVPVFGEQSRILDRFYRAHKHNAVRRIPRFPRDSVLQAMKFELLENDEVQIHANDGNIYSGRPMDVDRSGRSIDEYEFAKGEKFRKSKLVDEELREELNEICEEYLEESDESSESETHGGDDEKQGPGEKSRKSEIERTKFGVRLYSNDEKHFFGIGVWKSKNYPGHTTVCLYTAGRRLIYTLDKTNMKAFREEVSRGEPT